MRINIVGTGKMGRSIAVRALTGGHALRLVNPEAGSGQPVADEMNKRFPDGDVEYAASIGQAELTVFALPYDAALEVSKSAHSCTSPSSSLLSCVRGLARCGGRYRSAHLGR